VVDIRTEKGLGQEQDPSTVQDDKIAILIGDSPARCDQHDIKSEFKYTAEDDGAIEEFVRKTTSLAAHPHGTCAMRSQEEGGVCWAVGIGIA